MSSPGSEPPEDVKVHAKRGDGLSRHLATVSEGHTITVTDHGRPVARIVQVGQPTSLERLIAEGRVTPGRRRGQGQSRLAGRPSSPPSRRVQDGGVPTLLSYGEHRDQVIELSVPDGTPAGVAVLVHGGYWRSRFTRVLMEPLATDLLARGWVVANVEYRRVGDGGGMPATLEDVGAAMGAVAQARSEHAWPGPVISVGHSVGGQLALLTAGLPAYGIDAVVALAPVTDLIRTRAEGLGDRAVGEFIPQSPQERPEAYAGGSPLRNLPVGRPVLVVHGDVDTRVPLAHSSDYVQAARQAGDDVEFTVLPGVDHLALIDPDRPHWAAIMEWMTQRR